MIRIKRHAIHQMGELMDEIEASQGGRPSEPPEGNLPRLTRTEAAEEAGMSERQQDSPSDRFGQMEVVCQ